MTTAIVILGTLLSISTAAWIATLLVVLRKSGRQTDFQNNLVYEIATGKTYTSGTQANTPEPTPTEAGEIWNSSDKWEYPTQGLDPTLDRLREEALENEQILARMRAYGESQPVSTPEPGLEMEMDRAGMLQNPDLLPLHLRNGQDNGQ